MRRPGARTLVHSVAALGAWALLLAGGDAAAPRLGSFKSDGCSMFPDGGYYACCYVHDVAYWPGGTEQERKNADAELRSCIREVTGSRFLAGLMYLGVRLGGGPGHHTTYRWGFGWPFPYREDYGALTSDERKQFADKARALCESIKLNPLTGTYSVDGAHEISAAQKRRICPARTPA